MNSAVEDSTGVQIPSGKTYLSERQVRDMQQEISQMEAMLADPKARFEDRGAMIHNLRQVTGQLEQNAPPEVTPQQRDRIAREANELLGEIKETLCSYEEMRKNPPGAVGKYRRGEASPQTKSKIIRWKNLMRILHKGDDDPDISNIERFRPRVSTLNMDNAQIPGKQYFVPPASVEYQEGWERTFGGGEASADAVKELQQRITELEAKLLAGHEKKKRGRPRKNGADNSGDKPTYTAVALCGKEFVAKKSQHQANFGKLGHERSCDDCKEIASRGGDE